MAGGAGRDRGAAGAAAAARDCQAGLEGPELLLRGGQRGGAGRQAGEQEGHHAQQVLSQVTGEGEQKGKLLYCTTNKRYLSPVTQIINIHLKKVQSRDGPPCRICT